MSKSKKINPHNRPASQADVERAKKQAMHEAVDFAWAIIFTVLRDKEEMGREDLRRIWDEVNDMSDSVAKGYVSVADMKNVLKEEIGVVLA